MAEAREQKLVPLKPSPLKKPIKGIFFLDMDHTCVAGHPAELVVALQKFYQQHPPQKGITTETRDRFITQMITAKHIPADQQASLRQWMLDYERTHDKTFGPQDTDTITNIHLLIPPTGSAAGWRDLLTAWDANDGLICLVSRSPFKKHFSPYLLKKLTLDSELVQRIHIEENCLADHRTKNPAIQSILNQFRPPASAICVFCDDDQAHLDAANQVLDSIIPIRAHDNGNQLVALGKQLDRLRKPLPSPHAKSPARPRDAGDEPSEQKAKWRRAIKVRRLTFAKPGEDKGQENVNPRSASPQPSNDDEEFSLIPRSAAPARPHRSRFPFGHTQAQAADPVLPADLPLEGLCPLAEAFPSEPSNPAGSLIPSLSLLGDEDM